MNETVTSSLTVGKPELLDQVREVCWFKHSLQPAHGRGVCVVEQTLHSSRVLFHEAFEITLPLRVNSEIKSLGYRVDDIVSEHQRIRIDLDGERFSSIRRGYRWRTK